MLYAKNTENGIIPVTARQRSEFGLGEVFLFVSFLIFILQELNHRHLYCLLSVS